jgi:hypothetical protein
MERSRTKVRKTRFCKDDFFVFTYWVLTVLGLVLLSLAAPEVLGDVLIELLYFVANLEA